MKPPAIRVYTVCDESREVEECKSTDKEECFVCFPIREPLRYKRQIGGKKKRDSERRKGAGVCNKNQQFKVEAEAI